LYQIPIVHQLAQAADLVQAEHGHHQAAEHHDDKLKKIGPRHGDEAAIDRVAASQ